MTFKEGTTIKETREHLSDFLNQAKCYDICASCPVYPETGVGCCDGCPELMRDDEGQVTGCGKPNLTCLSHTCSVLNKHLMQTGRLEEFIETVYIIPREGRRGCNMRPDDELLQIGDPLLEITALIEIEEREEDGETNHA